MGFETFPQPSAPEERSPEQIEEEAELSLEWAMNSFKIWDAFVKNAEVPPVPENPLEAQSYIDKLEYLKEHNQEKYRDSEGKAIYDRIDAYIEQLKHVGN